MGAPMNAASARKTMKIALTMASRSRRSCRHACSQWPLATTAGAPPSAVSAAPIAAPGTTGAVRCDAIAAKDSCTGKAVQGSGITPESVGVQGDGRLVAVGLEVRDPPRPVIRHEVDDVVPTGDMRALPRKDVDQQEDIPLPRVLDLVPGLGERRVRKLGHRDGPGHPLLVGQAASELRRRQLPCG